MYTFNITAGNGDKEPLNLVVVFYNPGKRDTTLTMSFTYEYLNSTESFPAGIFETADKSKLAEKIVKWFASELCKNCTQQLSMHDRKVLNLNYGDDIQILLDNFCVTE